MPFGDDPGFWNFGLCESCLKNAGDSITMVKERIGGAAHEHFVCPQCGATKRL